MSSHAVKLYGEKGAQKMIQGRELVKQGKGIFQDEKRLFIDWIYQDKLVLFFKVLNLKTHTAKYNKSSYIPSLIKAKAFF